MILAHIAMFRKHLLWLLLGFSFAAQCTQPATPPLPPPTPDPTINIAVLAPNSGELITVGRFLQNGVRMAIEQYNTRSTRWASWRVYDSQCSFEAAQQAAQQAQADGYELLVGPLCAEAAIGAAEVAEQNSLLLIAPTGTHPRITRNGTGQVRSTVFSVATSWAAQGAFAAERARENHVQAALFYNVQDDYSTTLGESFRAKFEALGGEVNYTATFAPTDEDYAERLFAAEQAGATLLYLPADSVTANRVLFKIKELRLADRWTVLGTDSWQSEQLDQNIVSGSQFLTHFTLTDGPQHLQTWASDYQARYAIEPEPLARLGYEATSTLLTAIEQAETTEIEAISPVLEVQFDEHHHGVRLMQVLSVGD